MAIYIDDARIEWRGKKWCHLVADSIEEMRRFADELGFPKSWFHQRASYPHYDVPVSARLKALAAGAIAVSRRELVVNARALKAATSDVPACTANRQLHLFSDQVSS